LKWRAFPNLTFYLHTSNFRQRPHPTTDKAKYNWVGGGGGSRGFTCFTSISLGSFGLTWTRLDSPGLTWTRFDSLALTRTNLDLLSYLDSLGLTWIDLDSLGLTWTHLDPLGLTRTHLDSVGIQTARAPARTARHETSSRLNPQTYDGFAPGE
jgi:hypothetical protein